MSKPLPFFIFFFFSIWESIVISISSAVTCFSWAYWFSLHIPDFISVVWRWWNYCLWKPDTVLPFLWDTVFELNTWIHLSVRHRRPAWKYHHPSRVWLSDLSITCENAEEQLPKNCEESNHESTTHSGEGANEMRGFQNTPVHARARVTMRVPGAPSVTGQLCCLILCWTQLYLQPKGAHTAKVSEKSKSNVSNTPSPSVPRGVI